MNLDEPLVLQERQVIGKRLKPLRAAGHIPAVLHDHGKPSLHIMGDELTLIRIYGEAGKHHPLNLKIGGKEYLALIKDVHFQPAKRRMQHVVFQAIKQDEKVEAEVPIHIEGEIPAEKVGLMILHQLDHIQIEALPKDLPDEIRVDGSRLAELHDKITVADLPVPPSITVLTEADHPVASVVETKAQMSEEELEADAALAAEQAAAAAAEGEEAAAPAGEAKEGQAPAAAEGEAASQEAPKK